MRGTSGQFVPKRQDFCQRLYIVFKVDLLAPHSLHVRYFITFMTFLHLSTIFHMCSDHVNWSSKCTPKNLNTLTLSHTTLTLCFLQFFKRRKLFGFSQLTNSPIICPLLYLINCFLHLLGCVSYISPSFPQCSIICEQ